MIRSRLSRRDYDAKTLWRHVKPMVSAIEKDDGVLIIDDTIQEKPHTDENDLISWHFDHTRRRMVKGINLLNCVYHAGDVSLPVTYELITKPILYTDIKTRLKRRSTVTKNELMRTMLVMCRIYRYVFDSWFSAKENLHFIHKRLHKQFIVALKSNRKVALTFKTNEAGTSR